MNDQTKSWTFRPATLEDIDAAAELFNARSRHFYGEDQVEAKKMLEWWKGSRLNLETDTWSCWSKEGRMIGWAEVENPGSPYVQIECGVIVHPVAMEHASLWDELILWGDERCRKFIPLAPEEARVTAVATALASDEHRQQAWERHGYIQVRISNRMRIDFDRAFDGQDPAWPAGLRLRSFKLERDLEHLVIASQEVSRDHWGHVDQPLEEELSLWREWIRTMGSDFDPSLWFVAVDPDTERIAGYCLCEAQINGDPTRGYVASLGVRSPYRRQGLGIALLNHSFAELRRHGSLAVELDMDSENLTGALRLYTKAGMHPVRQLFTYEKELRLGIDLVRRALRP